MDVGKQPWKPGFLCPMLILIGVFGCAAAPLVPIDASGPIELAPTEALLIIHVDTDIALKSITLSNRTIVQPLGRGRYVWMVRIPEGGYRWRQIEIANQPPGRSKLTLDLDEELRFEVKAGKINYPGELSIRSSPRSRWRGEALIVRNRNHSAMAVRELRGSYDSILRSFPIHYAGSSGDGFLAYYMRERERPGAGSNGARNPEDRVDTQGGAP